MKFQVHIKDPDVFEDAIKDAVDKEVGALALPDDERDALREVRQEKARSFITKFVEYGEYVTLEFDTEARTAIVVERKDC